jgi:hypothetical protein
MFLQIILYSFYRFGKLLRSFNPEQFARWQKAQNASEPVEIVTLDEAKKAEKSKSKNRKTWVFEAENVRDFA